MTRRSVVAGVGKEKTKRRGRKEEGAQKGKKTEEWKEGRNGKSNE